MMINSLQTLLDQVQVAADSRFDEVLVKLLTSDIPEYNFTCCRKCGPLLSEYVRCKIALHRYKKRHHDDGSWVHRSCTMDCTVILEARTKAAGDEFHAVSDCDCGLQLWRGRRWRDRQAESYQERWLAYIEQHKPQEPRT